MLQKWFERILPRVAGVGAGPNDSAETRLQKSSLVLGSLMFMLAGALWGAVYVASG